MKNIQIKSNSRNHPEKFLNEDDAIDFKVFVTKLANISFENFDELPMNKTFDIPSSEYLDLIWSLSWFFHPEISSGMSIKLYMVDTITELGICYTFNSKIASYNSYNYWSKNNWNELKTNETVVVHPLDGEIYAQIINLSTSYEVYYHGAMEVPDISRQRYSFADVHYTTVELLALEIITTPEAKGYIKYKIKQ